MVRRGTLLALALALGASGPSPDTRQDGERYVYVTVLGRDGAPLEGLTTEHLAVRESGRDRPVTRVEPLTIPMHVALHVVAIATATRGSAAARVNRDIPSSSRTLGSMVAAGEGDRERTQMIEQGTAVTGGGRQRLTSTLALGPALARVRQELSRSYLVTFSRPGGGKVKDLQVGVFVDDVTVRATAAPYGTR